MPNSPDRLPTLADVAARAGVSTATVSRCLNAPDRVSPTARAAVMAAVAELGYAPNYAAQALAANRSYTVGVVIPTIENSVFARGVQAFQEALGEAGITLLVASSAYSPEREADRIRTLVARGADALMLIGFERDPRLYEFLGRRGVPVVVAWAWRSDPPVPCVGFDNRRAMRALAEAVLAAGHRRLAMISAEIAPNDRAADRVAGFRDALAAAGLDAAAVPVVETPYSVANGRAAAAALLARPDRPTAICCGNDVLAMGAIMAARDRGLRIPGDLSVTGFDDIELAEVAVPPLATVHVPHREMGRRAAALLLATMRRAGPSASVELATTLRLRASLGPPPAQS